MVLGHGSIHHCLQPQIREQAEGSTHHCMKPGSPVRQCLAAFLCHEAAPPTPSQGLWAQSGYLGYLIPIGSVRPSSEFGIETNKEIP